MLPVRGAYIWRGLYMEGLIFGILRYVATLLCGFKRYIGLIKERDI